MSEKKPSTGEKIVNKVAAFDIFGKGANFTFGGERIFKTKTGVCCTMYALFAFVTFLSNYFSRPFIPFDTDIVYNTVKKREELIEEKLNFESYLLYWFYINKDVTETDSVPYDYIEATDFNKFLHLERCVYRRWDINKSTGKKVFNKYKCKFSQATPEIQKIYDKAVINPPRKGEFGYEKPSYIQVLDLIGEENQLEASDYASLTIKPCTKTDDSSCEEARVNKYRLFVMHKPMQTNHDKRVVMSYYSDMVRRNIDIYEGNPLNYTVTDEFEPIKISQKGELSYTYIFTDNEINYFEFFPLRKHSQNMLSFLNGSLITLFGAFENYYGGHGATLIYRWGNEKAQVWLLTKFKVKSKEIAGMISMIGLIVVVIYGSYNTKRLDNNIMNSLAKDKKGNKLAEFKSPNIISFYLKHPGYAVKYYIDYSNPNQNKSRVKKVKEKMRKLLHKEEREKTFIKAAIEVLYNEELELTKIFYDDCRLQGFKESFLDEDTELLLRAAYIGRGLKFMKAVEENPTLNEKNVSLFGFAEYGKKVINSNRIAKVFAKGVHVEEEDNKDNISIGSDDGDSNEDLL